MVLEPILQRQKVEFGLDVLYRILETIRLHLHLIRIVMMGVSPKYNLYVP